jgi:SnoaL-like domain
MSQHLTISPSEAADRLAIRELIEAYARCANRRDAKGQMALFTADTHFVVYMNAKDPSPSQELHPKRSASRAADRRDQPDRQWQRGQQESRRRDRESAQLLEIERHEEAHREERQHGHAHAGQRPRPRRQDSELASAVLQVDGHSSR